MNLGITHNKRPGTEKKKKGFGLNAIAKQMGIDPRELGKEAENMWKMLDDLSESNPQGYREFIEKQLQEGPPPESPHFIPDVGFVTKAMTIKDNKKIFLNCCSHLAIEKPKDAFDRIVSDEPRELRSTSGIQIPLVIGEIRQITDQIGDQCSVLDVVFHPWVLKRSEWDHEFKLEVVKLAVEWVEKEKKIDLKRPSKLIKSQYKGGKKIGHGIKAVPFIIKDDPNDPNDSKGNNKKGTLVLRDNHQNTHSSQKNGSNHFQVQKQQMEDSDQLNSSSVLQAISKMRLEKEKNIYSTDNDEDTHTMNLILPQTQPLSKRKGCLIEEINPDPDEQTLNNSSLHENEEHQNSNHFSDKDNQFQNEPVNPTSTSTRNPTTKGFIKKGFLNNSKVELYPEGSSEGLPPSSYVKLLSRSKVIDLSQKNPIVK